MAIVKMKRLRLIGLTEEREALLSTLLRLGCVEVVEPKEELASPEWQTLVQRDEPEELSVLRVRRNAVSEALSTMKKYTPKQFHMMEKRDVISEETLFDEEQTEKAWNAARVINDSTRKIARLLSRETKLEAERDGLLPWKSLDIPLESTGTKTVKIFLGTCPANTAEEALRKDLMEAAPLSTLSVISRGRDQLCLLVICHRDQLDAADEVLHNHIFTAFRVKDLKGRADENILRLEQEKEKCVESRKALENTIRAQESLCQALKLCQDRLTQDLARATAQNKLMTNGTILYLKGWIPASSIATLEKELTQFCCATEFTEPTEDDQVPTLLKNPKWMRCINMVTEMYSLPEYRTGIDPNPLIFFIYILFFGFMFADIGYGIIIFAISRLIHKKFKPKNTMGYMFELGQYLGISTVIFGVLTGGFFGDFLYEFTYTFTPNHVIRLPALISPLESPMQILVIAVVAGCVHLIFGQCVHIYMEARDGHIMEGILDVVPWWILFAGIGLFAVNGTAWGIIAGFAALLLTQGRHKKGFFGKLFGGIASWYDITSWLGDVLSYSRLMALMLATTVIAQVMNILGTLAGNVVVFFLIFIIGHVFNIGINLIGTYVHAARLQYLEFFTKFYKEGGRPFQPLRYETRYVDVADDSGEVM